MISIRMTKSLSISFVKQVIGEVLMGNFSIIENFKYYQKWKSSLEPGRNSISDEQPWITFPVIDLLKKSTDSNTRVFEYGGGLNLILYKSGKRNYYRRTRSKMVCHFRTNNN